MSKEIQLDQAKGWRLNKKNMPVAKGKVSNSGWFPTSLGGLVAWYQFNTGITVTGAGVSVWTDQSGNSNHLLQATDTNRPAKQSDGSILFDGVDNYLKTVAFTLNQPTTVYFLGKQVTWTTSDKLIDGDSYQVAAINQTGSSPGLRIIAGLEAAANDNLALDTYGVISAVFDGASSLLQIDNTTPTTGDAGTSNAGGITLGAAGNNLQFAHTQIKEVVIYSVAHDASTRRQVIDYLSNVGGL